MQSHIEDDHQLAVIQWADYQKINLPDSPAHNSFIGEYLIAIPNGGTRNKREAGRLKKLGVRPGVPDMLLHVPLNGYGGLWLELKRPASVGFKAGKLSNNQKKKIKQLNNIGYKAVCVYGFDEATAHIRDYLNGRPT